MLDVDWSRPNRVGPPPTRMPVDFAAYLLSASPPGMGFYTGPSQLYQGFNATPGNRLPKPTVGDDQETDNKSRKSGKPSLDSLEHGGYNGQDEINSLSRSFLEYCQVRDRAEAEPGSEDSSTGSRTPRSRPASPRTPTSPGGKGMKKRVSFADDLGLALENIRIMSEPSDTPPRLKPDVFRSLTQGATAGAAVAPPLELNFQQPASDYLEFRRRIETDCVCLENVILKDYSVMGTIKVKNISFEKHVTVRCTFDNWTSTTDHQATYVANAVSSSQFDTFSFNISVPTNMKSLQFCINYKANVNNFWDNNKNQNYEIVTADWKQCCSSGPDGDSFRPDSAVFYLGADQDWSTYSSWSNRDISLPYY